MGSGELRPDIRSTRKSTTFTDRNGVVCTWNDNLYIMDDKYPVGHHRHEVARAHRHRAEDGTIGASGQWDPKELMIGHVNFRKFETKGGKEARCQWCESGDMIPPKDRFRDSIYRPDWPRRKRAWRWFLGIWFRLKVEPCGVGLRHAIVRILQVH